MDIITVVAYMMGIGMIGGAAMGWITILALLINETVLPFLRNLGAPRRQARPALPRLG